jgi:hypothetical protein
MALEETKDLVAACEGMGIAVPLVFLNLMTPPGDCRLCSNVRRRELLVADSFRQAFPDKQQTLVYRQAEIAGMERLEKFGRRLYQPAIPEMVSRDASETIPGADRFTPELCGWREPSAFRSARSSTAC